ncbi:hypothetical protein KO488_14245 [Poseidonibacter lekithochrous]|uniref:hypothetical protein n=1 Tax=Poseidonibacter TaxID=2321187 RepID=UPI001C097606|nr:MULTISPECIES: hypothetical protein [Poseidonibacter]MBU3015916.1 hypothetical protein [Poseidonibacter lekithochrous]MDO6829215.1 hypothetical protein [Poseidonibacter sp. 1_MG-2023]
MLNEKNLNLTAQWAKPFADMFQGLIFINQEINQDRIVTQELNDCLLSEEEILRGKDYWATRNDPFPTWEKNV